MEPSAADPADPALPIRRPGASVFDLPPTVFQWLRGGIVLAALVLHVYWLDGRPPHFDEGVNGWFTDQMQKIGRYNYDPKNYHGPLHFYVLFLFKCLFGRNLWALRLPTALIGVLTIDWVFRFGRFFDRRLCVVAALGMTFSSGMLYYQRDAIHETWLVFFLVLGAWGVFGLWQEGRKSQLWAVGLALTGMITTKETYLIHLGCLALAMPCLLLFESLQPSRLTFLPAARRADPTEAAQDHPASLWTAGMDAPPWWTPLTESFAPQRWRESDAWAVASVAVALVIFFYSGNFLNWPGIAGLWEAYTPWGHKAVEGEGHNKVFSYWCKLIVRNEPLATLGVVACLRYAVPAIPAAGRTWPRWVGVAVVPTALAVLAILIPSGLMPFAEGSRAAEILARAQGNFLWWLVPLAWLAIGTACLGLPAPGDWRVRLLAIVGTGTLVAYSIIPYKTPWCIISILWPFFFVAGALLAELADLAASTASHADRPAPYGRWIAWPLGTALLAVGGWESFQLSYVRPTDELEDYVYVQTFPDMWDIVDPMLNLAKHDPTAYELPGVIICGSTYPLPWMLGDFERIGYYADKADPGAEAIAAADFLLVVDQRVEAIEPMLKDAYYRENVRLRSALEGLTLYLRASRFQPVMDPNRSPEFQPTPAAPAVPAMPGEPAGTPPPDAAPGTGAPP